MRKPRKTRGCYKCYKKNGLYYIYAFYRCLLFYLLFTFSYFILKPCNTCNSSTKNGLRYIAVIDLARYKYPLQVRYKCYNLRYNRCCP